MFNLQNIMNNKTSKAGDVNYIPIPAGDWPAVIKDLKVREDQHPKVNEGKPFAALDIMYLLDSQQVRDAMERQEVTITQGIILDMKMDSAGNMTDFFDDGKGKNVELNRVRDAVGLNEPGQEFSLGMLIGRVCTVTVSHSPRKDGKEGVYANVTKVGRR